MKIQPSLFAAAIVLMASGILATFLPEEVATAMGGPGAPGSHLATKLLGAALFALGMLDWMSRFATIGGIFGRPVVLANFTCFFIAATSLLRHAGAAGGTFAWAAFGVTAVFAAWFTAILFLPSPAKPGANP